MCLYNIIAAEDGWAAQAAPEQGTGAAAFFLLFSSGTEARQEKNET